MLISAYHVISLSIEDRDGWMSTIQNVCAGQTQDLSANTSNAANVEMLMTDWQLVEQYLPSIIQEAPSDQVYDSLAEYGDILHPLLAA